MSQALPHPIERSENCALVRLGSKLSKDSLAELSKPEILGGEYLGFILNLTDLQHWDTWGMRALAQFSTTSKNSGLKTVLINCPPELREDIAHQGLSGILPTCASLRAACHALGVRSPLRLEASFVNTFIDAIVQTLTIQAQTPTTPGKPVAFSRGAPPSDISGVIGIVSDTFSGNVIIGFPEKVYLGIAGKMLGIHSESITPELEDAASEIVNIVFGVAKVSLNQAGWALKQALPSVVRGLGHSIGSQSTGPRISIPFETPFGQLSLTVVIEDQLSQESKGD